MFWVEHFSYYPFTFDRDDQRLALLISNLTYIEGRQLKNPIDARNLIPDYLGERKINTNKTLEEQQKEFSAFASKLKSMSKK